MIDSEPSWPSNAIEPDEAIGPSETTEVVGRLVGVGAAALAAALALARGSVSAGEGAAGLTDGAGLPHATTTIAAAIATHGRRARDPIWQRYAPDGASDPRGSCARDSAVD
jgi:hypothetical protein